MSLPAIDRILSRLEEGAEAPEAVRENPMEISLADKYLITTWLQGPRYRPTFRRAESSFVFGAPDTGKSRLLVRLALMFRKRSNAKIVDAFGAENDNESTVWALCPETKDKTLFVVGNEVKVEGWDNCMPIGGFTLEKAKDFDVVVTDRALFGPVDDRKWDFRYYAGLARIFSLVRWREGGNALLCLAIREAWNVVYSQIKAGISRDQQQAMEEFKKMHNQRFHSRVAPLIDTQRYTDLSASVRGLTDYRYIKGFGSMQIPDELTFLFKPRLFGLHDWLIRNTPIDEFILLTMKNGVARGIYGDVDWHIQKGFSPLRKLGIKVTLKPKVGGEQPKDPWGDAAWLPSNNDLHRRMKELHDQGFSYKDIAAKMEEEGIPMSWQKVRYHLSGQCSCEVTTAQPTAPGQGPLFGAQNDQPTNP